MSYEKGKPFKDGPLNVEVADTTAPDRYTDGTLISAMTHIYRHVTNEADRKILRDTKGIGTERTRDSMIEKLKYVTYMFERKKATRVELHPSDLGIELVEKLPPQLTDPVTTAKWEMGLGLIALGKMAKQQFRAMIDKSTAGTVDALRGVTFDVGKLGVTAVSGGAARSGGGGGGKAPPEVDATIPGHGATCEKCRKAPMKGIRFASGKKKLSCTGFPACKNEQWVD